MSSQDVASVVGRMNGAVFAQTDELVIPRRRRTGHAFLGLERMFFGARPGESPTVWVNLMNTLSRALRRTRTHSRPIASAPVRSRPERTYDPRRDVREPEGSHVPMTLATLFVSDPARFDRVAKSIAEYGAAAGLFSKLDVKQLGRVGDPFQLAVTVDKYPFNVTDVGYGVSQVLPILFETLASEEKQTFLLQQPEVHLHPKA